MQNEPHSTPREQTPPSVPPRITAAPKLRQLYWCDVPRDAQLPESRLSAVRGKIPQVTKEEFNEILKRLILWLPRPFELDKSPESS